MATYYAWSEIHGTDADGKAVKVMPGDKVSAADLNLEDEEFEQLVEGGSVREIKFPEDVPTDQAPADYARQKLLEMANQGVTPEQAAGVKEGVVPDTTASQQQQKAAETKR